MNNQSERVPDPLRRKSSELDPEGEKNEQTRQEKILRDTCG